VSARFWLNLQTAYELAIAEREIGALVREEIKPAAAWARLRARATLGPIRRQNLYTNSVYKLLPR